MAGQASRKPRDTRGAPRLSITGVNKETERAVLAKASGAGASEQLDLSVKRVRPAYEQVAHQLRDLMMSAELLPGQRLPSEADLAAMFGVGRTTIREGLRLLTSQQLLVTTRGVKGGTFVVTPEADNISRYLETSIGLLTGTDRLTIGELLESRVYLELPAVRLATSRHNEAQLSAVAATVQFGPEPNLHMEHSNFHLAILQASGNRMLEVMARPIFDVLRTRLDRGAAPAHFWERVMDDHRRIYKAMSQRNEAAASREMAKHLDHLASVYTDIDVASRSGDADHGGSTSTRG